MDCSKIRINQCKIGTVLSKYLDRINKKDKSDYQKNKI